MSHWPRQQPGSACEECRKRKLRCDRERPKCGTCINAGHKCEFNTERLPRGPKRGSLKALRSRIGMLHLPYCLEERLLEQQMSDGRLNGDKYMDLATEIQAENLEYERDPSQPSSNNSVLENVELHSSQGSRIPANSRGAFMNDLIRADLDQLYFDRVHAIVPIINKQRYFSWAKDHTPGNYRACLQNAMWTLAMSLSSQFENMRELLYTETRQMLEERDLGENDMNVAHIEQVQAWILVTFYEFLRCSYRRAWCSAGRVFRLIQLLRLHEVDSPPLSNLKVSGAVNEDNIMTEEKRRAFWVAYCLDRFISVHNGLPLTLNEEVICTWLPCLESDFESGQHSQGCSLSEAIASGDQSPLSPLAECTTIITLYGRALSHYHVSRAEKFYGNTTQDFWMRHQWIDTALGQRQESFLINHPPVSIAADPILLLTHMVLQSTTLYLYKIMEPITIEEQCNTMVIEYQKRAIAAAKEIARLTQEHGYDIYFKGHVFMPAAIFLGAERLTIERNIHALDPQTDEEVPIELESCLDILRKVQSVNNLAKYYLNLLESEDFIETHVSCHFR
ncbi:hypothetical protein OIDMADRAFT_136671 [Oidiodendron maius Zn]|uniref:Zn(2)-C6 fungal-type domain-containing protein n=1 Tax=Oidiodendron maius (strain Zn) TaxID=913774 RepID=A0A0C3C5F8_OIDMZ|nr:hypothetical protein OIDMADRAFT_136671 [Oidiodendron maius Zn]